MEAIIFIGVQASGKSSFYREFFGDTHVHINLDTLRTRSREAELLSDCLKHQRPFVVDNTNPTRADRARYVQPAQAAAYRIVACYFQSRVRDALARNALREGIARVPDRGILSCAARLELPSLSEGFAELYYVAIDPVKGFRVEAWRNEL